MFVCAHKVLGLLLDNGRDLIYVVTLCMWTLCLPTKPLLAEANDLGALVYRILLHRMSLPLSRLLIKLISILGEEILARNLLDSGVKIDNVFDLFIPGLILA